MKQMCTMFYAQCNIVSVRHPRDKCGPMGRQLATAKRITSICSHLP